ncbi:Gfo/Idh/MocA family protein [Nakamurella lactea]|uniref:Gfo/Idh/MocA family protein n=1 Tax=Nakamurella lactea TaxID=459515 RepID=UPI00048DDB2B|nr:Gfo/Idh/MocA family oxidoreductase [Nakamurella lactea]
MQVDLALVGLGEIGIGAHLPALLRHPEVRVVALVDPVQSRRDAARAIAPDVPAFGDLTELPVGMDGVVLATPPWITTGLAARLAHEGVRVLAEKPIAVSTEAAAPLAGLPAEAAARVQIGLTYRHDPAMDALKALVDSGRLGSPLLVRAHIYDERLDAADVAHSERIQSALAHGVPVIHEGAHVFDWLSHLFGGAGEVLDCWSMRTDPANLADNLTGGRLRYPDGSTALVEFGWYTAALPVCELSLLGSNGLVVMDARTFEMTVQLDGRTEMISTPGDRTLRSFDRQLQRFVELITGRRSAPSPSIADGLDALWTAERIAAVAER